jgi:hypothetical protein
VAETQTQGDEQPDAVYRGASSRVPAIVAFVFGLAVIGAATANFLPNFDRFSLPNFSLPNLSWPDLSWSNLSWPNFDRFAAQSPHETASVPIPAPAVSATPKDIQLSQQNAAVLVSLVQSSATQQADLKRISRQLSSLAAQADAQQQNAAVLVSLVQSSVTQESDLKRISRQLSSLAAQTDALQSTVTPLTTSSIPHSNTRAAVVGTSRKINSPLPKPVGPVSVGGAPLGPAPAPRSRAG